VYISLINDKLATRSIKFEAGGGELSRLLKARIITPRDIPSYARSGSQVSRHLPFCPPAFPGTAKATVLRLDITRVPVSI
jgi:hypothetical protein